MLRHDLVDERQPGLSLIAFQIDRAANGILLQNYGTEIFPGRSSPAIVINARFQAVRELLDLRGEDTFERHPSAMLEIFLLMTQRPAAAPAAPAQ